MNLFRKLNSDIRVYRFYLFLIFIYCFYLSWLDSNIIQRSIDGGLIVGKQIKYPNNSIILETTNSLFTSLHQVSGILLYLTDSIYVSSFMIQYLSLLILCFGIIFIGRSMDLDLFSISLLVILFTASIPFALKNLTNVYPLILRADATYGIYGLSLAIFTVSFFMQKKFFALGFMLPIFVITQAAWALWTVLILTLTSLLLRDFRSREAIKKILRGAFFSFPILAVSVIYFILNRSKSTLELKSQFSVQELWFSYISYWDYHRSLDFDYLSVYLNLLIFLTLVLVLRFGKIIHKNTINLLLITMLSLIISTSLYLLNDNIFGNKSILLSSLMPGRFNNLHPVLLIFILLSLLRISLKNRSRVYSIFVTILFALIYFYPNLTPKIDSQSTLNPRQINSNYKAICNSLMNSNLPVLTLGEASRFVTLECKLPILIDTTQIDFAAYNPNSLFNLSEITSDLYGINFMNPVDAWASSGKIIRPSGSIDPQIVKSTWSFRNLSSWENLACKYGFSNIVTDSTLKLGIPLTYKDELFSIYSLKQNCNSSRGELEIFSNIDVELTKTNLPFQWVTDSGIKTYFFNPSKDLKKFVVTYTFTPNPCGLNNDFVFQVEGNKQESSLGIEKVIKAFNLTIDPYSQNSIGIDFASDPQPCFVTGDDRNLLFGISQISFN
jgi:hypothetical protein